MTRFAACAAAASPRRPTILVGFEFTGAMRLALESAGRRALSVDWRTCEAGGMHAVLDVRDVVELGGWERVFLFPPCFQQLRADRDCLQAKIADCRAFYYPLVPPPAFTKARGLRGGQPKCGIKAFSKNARGHCKSLARWPSGSLCF